MESTAYRVIFEPQEALNLFALGKEVYIQETHPINNLGNWCTYYKVKTLALLALKDKIILALEGRQGFIAKPLSCPFYVK